MNFPFHGKQVEVISPIVYGNPGQNIPLEVGTRAIAYAATNLPEKSPIHYWLRLIGECSAELQSWSDSVGCGVHTNDIKLSSPNER